MGDRDPHHIKEGAIGFSKGGFFIANLYPKNSRDNGRLTDREKKNPGPRQKIVEVYPGKRMDMEAISTGNGTIGGGTFPI